jgi:hypothetical protein
MRIVNRWCALSLARTVATVAFALMTGAVMAAVPYSEDWSAGDTNGWQIGTTSTTLLRDDTEGNPAASLVLRRILEAPIFDLSATTELPAVSGDYTGAPAWMVSFDVRYDTGGFTDTQLRFRYQDSTFDGWHKEVADVFPDSWQSYSVMFDPSWTDAEAAADGWVDDTAGAISWQTLMGDVYHPEVRLLLSDENSAIGHVDNFVLKAVPEPGTMAIVLIGIGGCGVMARGRGWRRR